MLGKRIAVGLIAVFLLAVPIAVWWAYDWAYHGNFAFKTYPWLSDVGCYLRLIAGLGVCIEVIAWTALLRYAMKPSRTVAT